MSIVENIKSLCEVHGITIPKLEKAVGFSKGSIYNWDKNSPSVDKIQKVANHFKVSVDRILYGFDLSEFTNMVNIIKGGRSIEQFASETGLQTALLFDICLGLIYDRPSKEIIDKIMAANPYDIIVSEDDLLEAAGYISNRQGNAIRERKINELIDQYEDAGFIVRLENEDHYEKMYIDHSDHGTVEGLFLHEFVERGFNLLYELKEKYKKNKDLQTIAAHHDNEEWTEEELEEIEQFKEFVKAKRNKK